MADPFISLEILRRLGFDVSHLNENSQGNNQIMCAFHKDSNPSASVDIQKGVFHCFSCNEGESLTGLFYEKMGTSIYKVLGIKNPNADAFAREGRKFTSTRKFIEVDYDTPPEVSLTVEGKFCKVTESPDCLAYLEKRGIPLSIANQMRMSFAIDAKTTDNLKKHPDPKRQVMHYRNRLVIPIYDNGKLISLEGRDIYPKREGDEYYKKVIYPCGASTQTIYQYDKLDKTKTLYVVEGLMDLAVLRTDPFFKNSTALFGSGLGCRKVHLLSQFKEIIYIIDNDKAGYQSLKKLKESMEHDFYVLFPPFPHLGVKDVGDIPTKANTTVEDCRNRKWLNSMRLASFIDADALIAKWDNEHPEKKAS